MLVLDKQAKEMMPGKVVVKLSTSYWISGSDIIQKRTIRYQKRLSTNGEYFLEDVSSAGPEVVMQVIKNLNTEPDGLYELIMTDVSHDWETGYVDDWSYELVPYEVDDDD